MKSYNNIKNLFLQSALTEKNPFLSTNMAIGWIQQQNNSVKVRVNRIHFSELEGWSFKKEALRHDSGRFFSIEGIAVSTNWGRVHEWNQPIINQPEVGYLGIITKEFDGILYFLLQAKVEPGNVNNVQLSPTLQATRSNYSQVHKGRSPHYLEYFQKARQDEIILDQLQSEQGARFLKKRNRNIILKIDGNIEVEENFIWLTLGQIKKLLTIDNLVNMDTRTVISGIPFPDWSEIKYPSLVSEKVLNQPMIDSATRNDTPMHSFDEILKWLTNLKCSYDLQVTPISLFKTKDWLITDTEIYHQNHRFFKVIPTQVEISNREVSSWFQPLIEPLQEGIIGFIYKQINNIPHFLIQAKLEPGNFDILEMAPTVQCITGSYKDSQDIPFLQYILNAHPSSVRHDSRQSEEGGRFYKEQNRNIIIEVDSDFPEGVPENYIWLTLNQINTFLKFNNYLNIQARSLISTIKFFD